MKVSRIALTGLTLALFSAASVHAEKFFSEDQGFSASEPRTRVAVRTEGQSFQTHYPSFVPNHGRSCPSMIRYVNRSIAPRFAKNPILQQYGIRVGLEKCKKVKN